MKFNILVQIEAEDALTAITNFKDGKALSVNPVQERPQPQQPVANVRGNSPMVQRTADIPAGAQVFPGKTTSE